MASKKEAAEDEQGGGQCSVTMAQRNHWKQTLAERTHEETSEGHAEEGLGKKGTTCPPDVVRLLFARRLYCRNLWTVVGLA